MKLTPLDIHCSLMIQEIISKRETFLKLRVSSTSKAIGLRRVDPDLQQSTPSTINVGPLS